MPIDDLTNTGMRIIGDESAFHASEKTFIVVGPQRSGTSMVSGALQHLGVFTGDQSVPNVYEDIRLAAACEQGTPEDVEAVVSDYDARYSVWAHKRPDLVGHFARLHGRVRNPVYLFVFKDLFAIANRNSISMNLDVMTGLHRALKQYRQIIGFIERRSPNGMLLSYNLVMDDKERFVDRLIDLIAPQQVSDEQRDAALEFITRNPVGYLNESRITRTEGEITHLDARSVQGYASYHLRPKAPVEIEVTVDGDVLGTVIPSGAGPDGAGITFSYEFPVPLSPDSRVSLRLTEDPISFAQDLRIEAGSRTAS